MNESGATYVTFGGMYGPRKVKVRGSVYSLGMFGCGVVKVGAVEKTTGSTLETGA